MLHPGVAGGVEPAHEHRGEERAGEVGRVVPDHPDRTQNLRRAPPAVLALLVRGVPLRVVPLESTDSAAEGVL